MSKEEMVNKVLEQCSNCYHRLSNDEDSDTHDDDYLEFLGEVHEAFDLDPLNPTAETEEYADEDYDDSWVLDLKCDASAATTCLPAALEQARKNGWEITENFEYMGPDGYVWLYTPG